MNFWPFLRPGRPGGMTCLPDGASWLEISRGSLDVAYTCQSPHCSLILTLGEGAFAIIFI